MITIERVQHSGAYVVSALVSDGKSCGTWYMSRTYYGYTKQGAAQLYRDYCYDFGIEIQKVED